MSFHPSDLRIEPVDKADDISGCFECARDTFGHQIRDVIWIATSPGFDTPEGAARITSELTSQWSTATRNSNGDLNTVFLKATLPGDGDDGDRIIVGFTIWLQVSLENGHGEPPREFGQVVDLAALYPDNPSERRFINQAVHSHLARRFQVVREKQAAAASPPAVMALDLCAVKPAFQGRGIATGLVRWGLDEAARRGGLEAVTEASTTGRGVYAKLGFVPQGEIEYEVDEKFKGRGLPSNLFMRTKPPQ